MREVRWERMFPDELERAFADCPVVYLAYGLCEPHGPHNAVGLDALKACGVAVRAARAHGGIVAPCDFWHVHEIGTYAVWARAHVGEVPRTWLTGMPPWQHFKNVCYHIRAVNALGFKGAILLTGHYGCNWRDLKTLVELIQPRVKTRLHALPDWEANVPGFAGDGEIRNRGDHAGRVETSLLWALEPDCVDMSRLPAEDAPGEHFAMGATARGADRGVGERMVDDEVRWLGAKARELLDAWTGAEPERPLRTFEDVEAFWDEAVRPRFRDFETMTQLREDQEPVPEDSVWFPNWPVPDRS